MVGTEEKGPTSCLYTHPHMHTHLYTHPPAHTCTHLLTHLLTQTCSCTHLLTHPPAPTHLHTQQEKLDTASPGLLNTLQPSLLSTDLLIFWVSLLLRALSLLGPLGPLSPPGRNVVFSPSSAVL